MSAFTTTVEVQDQAQEATVKPLETLQDAELAMIGGGGGMPSCD